MVLNIFELISAPFPTRTSMAYTVASKIFNGYPWYWLSNIHIIVNNVLARIQLSCVNVDNRVLCSNCTHRNALHILL